jgi:hypothetical protein
METQMLERVLALIELNLFATVVVGLVYGVLFVLMFREMRKGHQSLEHIAQMVRELHNR